MAKCILAPCPPRNIRVWDEHQDTWKRLCHVVQLSLAPTHCVPSQLGEIWATWRRHYIMLEVTTRLITTAFTSRTPRASNETFNQPHQEPSWDQIATRLPTHGGCHSPTDVADGSVILATSIHFFPRLGQRFALLPKPSEEPAIKTHAATEHGSL